MTAKEYLNRVNVLDIKIQHKIKYIEELRHLAVSMGSLAPSGDKVQSNGSQDKIGEIITKYSDLEAEVEHDMNNLIALKGKTISMIHGLEAGVHTKVFLGILYSRYIEYKPLHEIAKDLSYSYDRIRHLHGYALEAFKKQYIDELK